MPDAGVPSIPTCTRVRHSLTYVLFRPSDSDTPMSDRIPPLPETEADGDAAKLYGRVRDMLGADAVPALFLPMGRAPAFLSDFYMNLKKFVWKEGKLSRERKFAVALAVALKEGGGAWADFYTEHGRDAGLDDARVAEIAALVAANACYNTFFKFRKLAGTEVFEGMPVGLRASLGGGGGVDAETAELIDLVVSNLNACEPCVSAHVKKARQAGVADAAVLEAIQVAAVVYSGVQFTKSATH